MLPAPRISGTAKRSAITQNLKRTFEFLAAKPYATLPKRWARQCKSLTGVPYWDYACPVRIIARSTLKAFWEDNPEYMDAKEPALAWFRHAQVADWSTPADVKQDFKSASILKDGRVVFNVAGNKYRLVVWINYSYRVVYVRFIGTHAQYDKINAQTI